MSDEADRRIDDILSTVVPLADGARTRWLDEHCPDPTLRSVVEARLETRIAPDLDEDATIAAAPGANPEGVGIGARIGPCVLVRLIGEGGMGAVYEATQEGLGRRVAVKLMKSGLATQQARQRFAYEARLLAGLRHPGIAQVFEYGTHEGVGGLVVPYFVMELIPGGRPVTRHVAEAPLDRDAAVDLFARICDAVHYAHQHGVVHRDLKPANILVDDNGEPKVIDFGLARDLEDDAVTRSFETESGALVGTLPYMSPEQITGDVAAVDTRSDVYSLGVVLYELVCGRRPFDLRNLSLPDAVALVRDHPAPPPTSPSGRVDRDLARIISKSLHKEPERRYASADALAEDVRRFRRGLPVEARPSTLTYNLRLFARRNRALVAAAGLVLAASIAAATVSTIFAIDAERARDREAERADAAERLLESSNALSTWVMLEFVPRLRDIPGSTKLSEETVERVLEHLDEVSSAAGDDAEHARTIGNAYLQVGLIQGAPSFPNLGRTDDALASLDRACASFERLLERAPDDIEASINLGFAHSARAEIHLDMGRIEEGLAALGTWQGRLRRLLDRAPDDVRLMRVIINNHHTLCSAHRRRGDWAAAETEMHEAVALHRRVIVLAAEPARQERDLAGTMLVLADIAAFAGRPDDARRWAEEALGRFEVAYPAAADRAGADAVADFALGRRVLGDALLGIGQVASAKAEYERSLELREIVVASHPEEVMGLEALAEVIQRLADLEFGPGDDVAAAEPLYRRQLEISRRVRALAPENTEYRLRLQVAACRHAQILIVTGDLAGAEKLIAEQALLADALLAEEPTDPRFMRAKAEGTALRGQLCIGRMNVPDLDESISLVEQAIEYFESAIDIYDDIDERGVVLPGMLNVRAALRAQVRAAEEHLRNVESLDDQ